MRFFLGLLYLITLVVTIVLLIQNINYRGDYILFQPVTGGSLSFGFLIFSLLGLFTGMLAILALQAFLKKGAHTETEEEAEDMLSDKTNDTSEGNNENI